jgi:hypothetical protein
MNKIFPNTANIVVAQWPAGKMIGKLKGVIGEDMMETFVKLTSTPKVPKASIKSPPTITHQMKHQLTS